MKIEMGNTYFEGSGNGKFGVLALVKVIGEFEQNNQQFYEVEFVKNYASKWEKKVPKPGEKTLTAENKLYNSFNRAKDNFIKNMNFENERDIIGYIFK